MIPVLTRKRWQFCSPHDDDEEYPATSVDGDKNRSKTGMMMMMMKRCHPSSSDNEGA